LLRPQQEIAGDLAGGVMEVRVLKAPPSSSCQDKDYVRVQTCSDPLDDTVTLTTIERIINRDDQARRARVKPLVVRRPLAAGVALRLATSYAERKNIPIVYADTGGTE
jgi:hypothetical protein